MQCSFGRSSSRSSARSTRRGRSCSRRKSRSGTWRLDRVVDRDQWLMMRAAGTWRADSPRRARSRSSGTEIKRKAVAAKPCGRCERVYTPESKRVESTASVSVCSAAFMGFPAGYFFHFSLFAFFFPPAFLTDAHLVDDARLVGLCWLLFTFF